MREITRLFDLADRYLAEDLGDRLHSSVVFGGTAIWLRSLSEVDPVDGRGVEADLCVCLFARGVDDADTEMEGHLDLSVCVIARGGIRDIEESVPKRCALREQLAVPAQWFFPDLDREAGPT